MSKCTKCEGSGFTPWVTTCLDHPPCDGCTTVRNYCQCKTGRAEYEKIYGKTKRNEPAYTAEEKPAKRIGEAAHK